MVANAVSVVIPTLNEEKFINRTLSALKKQMEPGDEVVIVDSYSKDRTVKIARKYTRNIYFIGRCGIGPAKTFGAKKAKNKIIATLDADGMPDKNWLGRIRHAFADKRVNGVAGLGFYSSKSLSRRILYNIFTWKVFKLGHLIYILTKFPWMPVNNCAIKKSILFKYGGWRNVVCEDMDFATRAKGLNGIKYDGKMIVTLSSRRFEKEGFFKTVWLWLMSNLRIIFHQPTAATSYEVVR